MFKEASVWLLFCFALASSELRGQQSRGIVNKNALVSINHPYLFLRVPDRRAGAFAQDFENLEEDVDDYSDDDTMSADDNVDELIDENDDDDIVEQYTSLPYQRDDDDLTSDDLEDTLEDFKKPPSIMRKNIKSQHMPNQEDLEIESGELEDVSVYTPKPNNMRTNLKNQKLTVLRDQTDPLMVPYNLIDLRAHTAIDTQTGELSLIIPRGIFEATPPHENIVVLLGPSFDDGQGRANRVIVRHRRRNGFGVNVNPDSGGNRNIFRPSGNNEQDRVNTNNNVRIMRQNIYSQPIVKNINPRPAVQTINRPRLNQV